MPKTSHWIASYLIWFLLMLLAAFAAWRVHYTVIHLTERLIESPWRPTDWHDGSVASVSRLSLFSLGSIVLIYILWVEYALRQSVLYNYLTRLSIINFATLALITVISIALMQL
mgnify:CR=1 FL=1